MEMENLKITYLGILTVQMYQILLLFDETSLNLFLLMHIFELFAVF